MCYMLWWGRQYIILPSFSDLPQLFCWHKLEESQETSLGERRGIGSSMHWDHPFHPWTAPSSSPKLLQSCPWLLPVPPHLLFCSPRGWLAGEWNHQLFAALEYLMVVYLLYLTADDCKIHCIRPRILLGCTSQEASVFRGKKDGEINLIILWSPWNTHVLRPS